MEIQLNPLVNEIDQDNLVEDKLENMLEDLSDDAFIDNLNDYEEDTFSWLQFLSTTHHLYTISILNAIW